MTTKNKWKYATLTKDERLERIREGDSDVYESEKERIIDSVSRKNALGLDFTDDLSWYDTVSYNNALANGAENPKKSGYYGDILSAADLSKKLSLSDRDGVKDALSDELFAKNEEADKLYESARASLAADTEAKKRQAYRQAMSEIPAMKESYANMGLSLEGGTVKTDAVRFKTSLDQTLAALDELYLSSEGKLLDENVKTKLSNVAGMLKELREASEKAEKEAYEREQDKLANDRADAELEYKKEKDLRDYELSAENIRADNKAKLDSLRLSAAKMYADSAKTTNTSAYLGILKKYAGGFLKSLGLEGNYGTDASDEITDGEGKADAEVEKTLTREEQHDLVIAIRNMKGIPDAVKRVFFEQSGLGRYMSYEQAVGSDR